MATIPGPRSLSATFLLVLAILAMIAVPAALTLHTARVSPQVPQSVSDPSPYGYTVSLLLFIVPSLAIGGWLVPREGVHLSKKSFAITIAVLFPLGALLDFFFAAKFFTFPDPGATLLILAPALGHWVPIEEYVFYFTGFVFTLLLYVWLDEYWLAAYTIASDHPARASFDRIFRFHPWSLAGAVVLITAAVTYKRVIAAEPGYPGYFTFLTAGALLPSAALFPAALPVINWRAFSLAMFMVLLISLLWEATLGVPYGWWGFQEEQMIGIRITAWSNLPIEEVLLWIAVTYATVIVYENVRRWQASGRSAASAFLGCGAEPKKAA